MKQKQILLGMLISSLVSFGVFGAESSLSDSVTTKGSPLRLGVMAGMDFSSTSVGITNTNRSADGGSRTGVAGGVSLEASLSDSLALEPQLLYLQKGGTFGLGQLNYDVLEVPLLVKAKLGFDNVKLEAFGGPYLSLAVNKTVQSGSLTGPANELRDFDFGLHFGAGGEYFLTNETSLFLNARYMLGVHDLSTVANLYARTGGVALFTGLRMAI